MEKADKKNALRTAIEIGKAYAGSGTARSDGVHLVIERAYEKIVNITEQIEEKG